MKRVRSEFVRILMVCTVVMTCLLAAGTLSACGASQPSVDPGPQEAAADATTDEGAAGAEAQDAADAAQAQDEAETALRRARPSTAGALHVEGAHLVNQDGEPVVLFGASTHGLSWFPQYVNGQLFNELSGWGANVVRLALYTEESGGWCTDGDQAMLRKLVVDGVRYATNADMYVIVDWHILSDGDPRTHVDEAKAFWADISAELKGRNNVIYEICNEPNGATTWADVKAYAEQVIPVIRANDSRAVIIVGTPEWSQRVDQAAADPLRDTNVMYALHYYAATHGEDLRDRLTTAVQGGLPVFVSEFGICDASGDGEIDEASADAWLATLDDLGVSRVMWSLCNKAEAASIIASSCNKTAGLADGDLATAGTWLKARLGRDDAAMTNKPAATQAAPGTATFEQGDLTVSVKLENSWQVDDKMCYQYALTLKNNGGGRASWKVNLPFTEAPEFQSGWNAVYEVVGNELVVECVDYNGLMEEGATLTGIGFQVLGSASMGIES